MKSKSYKAQVTTNLEKKTRQKIAKMTSEDGANILLKDLKLLTKFKKCHVKVARLGKNTLGKISKPKLMPAKKAKTILVSGAMRNKRGRPSKHPENQAESQGTLVDAENGGPERQGRKRKAARSPENNKRNKEERKKRQIFIRLPFLETAKLKSLNKDLIEKHYNKKPPPIKKLGKTYLTQKFGGRYFRCHVRVARYRGPNDPSPKKKDKSSRKSVSFFETVEVFGESDDDLSPGINTTRTYTPAQEINNIGNEDNITVSPSRRKISLLKKTENPRSEQMRKSDEKVPRMKPVISLDEAEQEKDEESPTASPLAQDDVNKNDVDKDDATKNGNNKEDSDVDTSKRDNRKYSTCQALSETIQVSNKGDKVPDDEDVSEDKDHQTEAKEDEEAVKCAAENESGSKGQVPDEQIDLTEEQDTGCQDIGDDPEPPNNSEEQLDNGGNNNNANHIELSSVPDHSNHIFQDLVDNDFVVNPDADIFLDADDHEKDFVLSNTNNSEMSPLCDKLEENDQDSNSGLNSPNNIDSMLDDDESGKPQQTKFSLNTFFKSLKTKIISQRTEPIASTKNGSQRAEREGDQTVRDELTIK